MSGLTPAVAPNTPKAPGQGPPKIHLLTQATPNGVKPAIVLEELRLFYPEAAKTQLSYDVVAINFGKLEQKSPAYLKINPNGRIPSLVDDNFGGHNVWESASLELWLCDRYDPEAKLSFNDPLLRSDMLSWLSWSIGGIGPFMGQINYFQNQKHKDPFAIRRFAVEAERLFSVVEDGLASSDYLVGNRFSLADLNAWTWMSIYPATGLDVSQFKRVNAWIKRIGEREGVKNGLLVPTPRNVIPDDVAKQKAQRLKEYVAEGDKIVAAADAQ